MSPITLRWRHTGRWALAVMAVAVVSCEGATDPGSISVTITEPAVPPTLQTLGRTVQFTAEVRTSDGTVLLGSLPGWLSSNVSVATVSPTGLVTAVGNGTTNIVAGLSGILSEPVTVTVAQVASQAAIIPATVTFGALGRMRLLEAELRDSSSAPLPGSPAIFWTSAGDGATASVTGSGLVTALAVGTSDTAVAVIGDFSAKAPIAVTQVPHSLLLGATSDTLRTTGRTKLFSATVRDSTLNTIPGAVTAFSSTVPAVASIDAASGLATAVADGETNIQASSGAASAFSPLVVRRYATVFDLTPPSAALGTPAATQLFTSDARDSVDTVLPTDWLMRDPSIATTSPSVGTTTTVTASGNGMTFLIRFAGTRTDSAEITVTGQTEAPATASVTIGDSFFRSVANSTQNTAIDTVRVGGTVTWNWTGMLSHDVASTGSPTFTNSPLRTAGQYQFQFAASGTYEYNCNVHGSLMTGRIIVR